jgi:hypothetical protein
MKILASTPAERKRQVILAGVLVAAIGFAYWLRMEPGESTLSGSVAADGRTDAGVALPVPDQVRLAKLDDVPVLSDAGRNPFAYGVRPVPPPPPPPPVAAMPAAPLMPVRPPEPVGPPPIGLKLSGITTPTPGGRVIVTLQDPASKATFLASEGDVVDGRYKVVKVGTTSVVVSYVDGTGQRTLPLGG